MRSSKEVIGETYARSAALKKRQKEEQDSSWVRTRISVRRKKGTRTPKRIRNIFRFGVDGIKKDAQKYLTE